MIGWNIAVQSSIQFATRIDAVNSREARLRNRRMAQRTPVSVATSEPSARAGSKNHFSYGQLKIGARLTVCFAAFAFLVIGDSTVAVWQFERVEALARRSYEAHQRSLLIMPVP